MEQLIKFRAWSHKWDKMIYHGVDGYTIDVLNRKAWRDLCDDENISLMQFTGLTDKHGKEIYVGDLVKHEAWNYPFEVIFDTEKARFVCKLKGGLTQYIANDKLEIIGNIHQNSK